MKDELELNTLFECDYVACVECSFQLLADSSSNKSALRLSPTATNVHTPREELAKSTLDLTIKAHPIVKGSPMVRARYPMRARRPRLARRERRADSGLLPLA